METMIIVGGGLVGSLLSIFLAKKGYQVEVYERRPDIRKTAPPAGRSINLTICDRGFNALDKVGAGNIVRGISVPVYGRLIHDTKGGLAYQPYGNNNEAIHSTSRSELDRVLLEFAAGNFGVKYHFNEKCIGIDLLTNMVQFKNTELGDVSLKTADRVFGCDGAHSSVRMHFQKGCRFDYLQRYSEQGYKELPVPNSVDSSWTSMKNAIHIWPRGKYMLIGFPNLDGSFTCSLHLPFNGEISFETVTTEDALLRLFEISFPDVIGLVPNLASNFFSNPPNPMLTVKCSPWSLGGRIALVGDAAHSILPSYGQGANAGFEDCKVLYDCLERNGEDWTATFDEYESLRKPNTDAIADMCVEHFIELRDLVGDPKFLLKKEIERKISLKYPEKYKDLYSMITFSCMPYVEALRMHREQRAIIDEIVNLEPHHGAVNGTEIEYAIDELMRAG